MSEPLETAELLAFTKVVEAQSISRAASELRVPRATIGRRLARLEERLNVRLIKRTTRSLVLTDAGEALYRNARLALDAVREAELSVTRSDTAVRGDLRVSAPPITALSFHATLNQFVLRYPDVRLAMHFSAQHVDLLRGSFDVAIRGTSTLEPGLVARTLARTPMMAVASPAYLERMPPLRTPRDLRHHLCLTSFAKGELPQRYWSDRKGRKVPVEPRVTSNDIRYLCQAAIDGAGIAFLPYAQVQTAIESGQLQQVLAGSVTGESHLAVVYLEREFMPAAVRAFVDAMVQWAKTGAQDLWPQPVSPSSAALPTKKRAPSPARRR
ncbi:MAG TPA: LysR family transcriptional regulator [Polyangiales bacterium]